MSQATPGGVGGGASVQPEDRREREVIREPVARTTVTDRMDSGRLIAAVVAIIVALVIGYLLVTNLG